MSEQYWVAEDDDDAVDFAMVFMFWRALEQLHSSEMEFCGREREGRTLTTEKRAGHQERTQLSGCGAYCQGIPIV